MKRSIQILAALLGLSASLIAAAQSAPEGGKTRAQVYHEMAEYEAAGYNPARTNPRTWVDDVQAVSLTVHAQQRTAEQAVPAQARNVRMD